MDWFSNRLPDRETAELLKLIKREMRIGSSDNTIIEQISDAGIVKKTGVRLIADLIAKAREETRIPDPADVAAVEAAQPISFIDMQFWDGDSVPPRTWAVPDRIPSR